MGVFVFAGLLSIFLKYLMIGESGIMTSIYKGFDYNFYFLVPSYLCIPPAYLITKLLAKARVHMTKKAYMAVIGMTISFIGVPLIALLLPSTEEYFILLLVCFWVTFVFNAMYQAFFLSIASVYHPFWTEIFCIFQPTANLLVVVLKNISFWLKLSYAQDFTMLWSVYVLSNLFLLYFFFKLSKTEQYLASFDLGEKKEDGEDGDDEGTQKETKVDYRAAWVVIKWEAIGLFFTMFLSFVIYPGVFFSSWPITLFSIRKYILIMNTSSSICDVLGRILSRSLFAKLFIKNSFGLIVVIDIFVIYVYLAEVNIYHEGIVYTMFVLICFCVLRASMGVSCYFKAANEKAGDKNREAVGSMMTNLLLGGIAIGNMVSDSLPTLKQLFS